LCTLRKLARESRLADTSLPAEGDEPGLAAVSGEQGILQGEQLLVSPHKS
jgi:hypothetical protein